MGNLKRLTSLFVALILVLGCVSTGFSLDVDALEIEYTRSKTQDRSAYYSNDFKLSGNYADDVVVVAKAQIGKTTSELSYTEDWCANFANDTARLTGMPDNIVPYNYGLRASCGFMYQYMISDCSAQIIEDVNDVRTGDYVFYYCPSSNFYLHVGIVESPESYIEGNYGNMVKRMSFNYNFSCYMHYGYGNDSENGHVKRIFVRPNYTEPPKNGYTFTDPEKYSQYIPSRTLAYKEPVATSGFDVCWVQAVLYQMGLLKTVTGEYNKNTVSSVKKFQSLNNLEKSGEVDKKTMEALKNAFDNLIDPACNNFKSSKNIYKYDETVNISAKISNADSYRLVIRDTDKKIVKTFDNIANCTFAAKDIGVGAYTAYIKMTNRYKSAYSDTISFTVEKPLAAESNLNVQAGTTFEATELSWSKAENAVSYDLYILNLKDNSEYIVKKNITVNNYSVILPKGRYTAYVVSKNSYSNATSNKESITVGSGTPVDLGSKVYAQFNLIGNNLAVTGIGSSAALQIPNGNYDQIWYLEKTDFGNTYTLKNCENGKYLTLSKSNTVNLSSIKNTSAQRWCIAKGNGSYYLVPSDNLDKVVYALKNRNSLHIRASNNGLYEAFKLNMLTSVHNYDITKAVAPSCTEDGMVHYYCDICGESIDRKLSADGHKYIEERLEKEYSVFKCVYCGDSYEVGKPQKIKSPEAVEISETPDTPDASEFFKNIIDNRYINVPKTIKTVPVIMGDVDGDGAITAVDVLKISRVSVGIENLNDVGKVIADVDCDGKVTTADSLYLLREIVRLHTNCKAGDVIFFESEFDSIHLEKNDDK